MSPASLTLVIDASTSAGSVALFHGDTLAERRDVSMGASREDELFPAVRAMIEAGAVSASLGAIVCGSGPGSFTSLRIAAAVAKGLAHATGATLYAVPSLLLAAAAHDQPGRFLVHSDALRGERYAMLVSIDDALFVRADSAVMRIATEQVADLADTRVVLTVQGAPLLLPGIPVVPDAARVERVHGWRAHARVALATWEPAYGRVAEAQVKWEALHSRALPDG